MNTFSQTPKRAPTAQNLENFALAKEVNSNVVWETKEQERYFSRLNWANERQMQIFQKHFSQVLEPQDMEAEKKAQVEE